MTHTTAGIEPVSVARPEPARGRLRSVTLHGFAAALMYVSPLQLFVPTAFISSGLRNGRRGIWGAIFAATAIVVATLAVRQPLPASLNLALVLRLLLEIGVPSVAVSLLMRRSMPFGVVVLAGVGVAAIGFFATEALMRGAIGSSHYDAIVANFRLASANTVEMYRALGLKEETLSAMSRFSNAVAGGYIPGLLVAVSVLTFLMSVTMVPRLPAGRGTGGTYLFRNLSWPDALLFGFVAGGLAPLASGPARIILLNLLVVVGLLYLLQGLAIFRALVLRMGLGFFGVAVAYFLLGLLMLWRVAPFVLFLAGLFDPFFDFRNMKRKGNSDESHSD